MAASAGDWASDDSGPPDPEPADAGDDTARVNRWHAAARDAQHRPAAPATRCEEFQLPFMTARNLLFS